jgi:hypothetical protein
MTGVRLVVLLALAATGVLVGCGGGAKSRVPDLSKLPLVSGLRIVSQKPQCDAGANPYCAIELVVVDPGAATSTGLLNREHRWLLAHGWTGAGADTGDEHAADSPGHKLRVTYATAFGELTDIDRGYVKRTHATALALARALFDRSAAMALLLEVGAS